MKEMHKKIYASVGQPYFVLKDTMVLLDLCSVYDKILIHTPPGVDLPYFARVISEEHRISKREFLSFFDKISKKIIYTGYIVPKELKDMERKKSRKSKISIFVSRGGGVVYPKIITSSILSARYFPLDFHFHIVAGPSTSLKENMVFKKCLSKVRNVTYKIFEDKFPLYLYNCDIFVGTSGYNNTVQILSTKKKSVLIPFTGYSQRNFFSEQLAHAYLLKDYTGATILNYSNITPLAIAGIIQKKIKEKIKVKKIPSSWFSVAELTADFLMK